MNDEEVFDMKATEYFGGEFLKAEDIKQPMKLTIKKVEEREYDEKKKLVVLFDEIDKVFGLNKINCSRIIKWAGTEETDNWPGTVITLVKSSVEFDGKDVDCIRVQKKEEAA